MSIIWRSFSGICQTCLGRPMPNRAVCPTCMGTGVHSDQECLIQGFRGHVELTNPTQDEIDVAKVLVGEDEPKMEVVKYCDCAKPECGVVPHRAGHDGPCVCVYCGKQIREVR